MHTWERLFAAAAGKRFVKRFFSEKLKKFLVYFRPVFSRFFAIRGNLGNAKRGKKIHLSSCPLTEEIRLF